MQIDSQCVLLIQLICHLMSHKTDIHISCKILCNLTRAYVSFTTKFYYQLRNLIAGTKFGRKTIDDTSECYDETFGLLAKLSPANFLAISTTVFME